MKLNMIQFHAIPLINTIKSEKAPKNTLIKLVELNYNKCTKYWYQTETQQQCMKHSSPADRTTRRLS